MDCYVFIRLLDQISPEASIALLVRGLPRADVSVCFCLSPAQVKRAGSVALQQQLVLGKE